MGFYQYVRFRCALPNLRRIGLKAIKSDSCQLTVIRFFDDVRILSNSQLTTDNPLGVGIRRSLLQDGCWLWSVVQKKRRGWKPRLQSIEIRN